MKYFKETYSKYSEVINYLITGVLTTLISLAVYFGCTDTFLNPENPIELQIANILSWILSVTFAYFTNRKYVFKSTNSHIFKEGIHFYLARISTLILDMAFMFVCVSLFHMNNKFAKLLDQVVVIIANYIISKFWVFSKKAN